MFKWLKYFNMSYISGHEDRMKSKLRAANRENQIFSRSEYCQISLAPMVEFFWGIGTLAVYMALGFTILLFYLAFLFVYPISTLLASVVGAAAFVWFRCQKSYKAYLEEKT